MQFILANTPTWRGGYLKGYRQRIRRIANKVESSGVMIRLRTKGTPEGIKPNGIQKGTMTALVSIRGQLDTSRLVRIV